MTYRVTVDWAPAYELVASLDAYLLNMTRNMDLGSEWVEAVRARLSGPLEGLTKWPHCEDPFVLAVLIRQAPEPRTADSFLAWLGEMTPGELYERLLPFLPAGADDLLRSLPETLSRYKTTLTAWHEQYFRTMEQWILTRLAAEATRRSTAVATQLPVDAVEAATFGLVVESADVDEVWLVPQFHMAPIVRYSKCNRSLLIGYAVEPESNQPGMPPARLVRTAKALGDENRLRVLHFLADGKPHTFTEVQRFTGLAKNSVHYHLATLRAAGLTQVHVTGDCCNERYTARRTTIDQFGPSLQQYLDER